MEIIRVRPRIALGLLLIFCFIEVRSLLPFLDYCVNYEYISEVLCINKDKPMSNCNGKCYLSKQLEEVQKLDKDDKKLPNVEQERIPMIVYNYEFPKFEIRNSNSKKHNIFYQSSIRDLVIPPPTPPPQC
ncbi:hypothetical protein [Mesonia sp.]|uniref:hypothetical protein n=1 Tax=Mesonia sp. TaxID=1960830 RepID=UPI003F9B925C